MPSSSTDTFLLDGLSAATSRGEAQRRVRDLFGAEGVETPALDARVLLADALRIEAAALIRDPDVPLGSEGAVRVRDHVTRRLGREPVARILGRAEFWGLPFRLSPETLVPRADTETLVEAALAGVADRAAPLRILDLGTGSGCLLIAILHELTGAIGIGVDRSAGALATARLSAEDNGVDLRATFLESDWGAALAGPFDLIVSNPPYIPEGTIASLEPEVARHDPMAALDGGPDGLDSLRAVLSDIARLLAPDGRAIVEIGYDQAGEVDAIAARAGLVVDRIQADLCGHPRAVVLAGPPSSMSGPAE